MVNHYINQNQTLMKTLHFIKRHALLFILLFSGFFALAQTAEEQQTLTERYDKEFLKQLESEFRFKQEEDKKRAVEYALRNNIPIIIPLESDGTAELQKIDDNGNLIYYRTFNVAAARTTRTNHVNIGGSTGLNLDGQNMIAHVWDAGHARITHQEYDGPGGNDRVSIEDASSEGGTILDNHAAHVTGTIAASGFTSSAKGMAPQSRVRGYRWNNDLTEATSAASNGMLVSNHSYGYRSDQLPAYYFGAYVTVSRDWDNLMFNAPYYLMVAAAGNDGTTNYNTAPLDPNNPQYDKLTGFATSKNNLVVASCNDASVDNNGNITSVSISSFSSQGPTDDLRIKPDITGNGAGVYSTFSGNNSAYGTYSGTSMASPNVSGSLLLLQQHAKNVTSAFMRAATLKGLVLHTADDAGPVGPDAIWGWGVMNSKRAAEVISANGTHAIISELTLSQGQTYSVTVNSDGISKLMASISWTDRPGTATTATNSTLARLVNDLDIRITKNGTTHFPWRLTAVNANGLGDNTKDPFERVEVANASGLYTITITHKGTLSGNSQNYTLIITGINNAVACNATTPTGLIVSGVGSNSAILTWNTVAGASYELRYRPTGTSTWTVVATGQNTVTINNLSMQTQYESQVRSVCPSGSSSAYSASVLFTTSDHSLTYCSSKGNNVNDEFIGRVQLQAIDNTSSSGGGYSDFTNLSAVLKKQNTYTITITPVWTGTVYPEGYSVWIDYNRNGSFDDPDEQVFSLSPTTASPVSGNFTVPDHALEGLTRMRVSMKYNGFPGSCETFTYGEVEDYTIDLTPADLDTQAPTAPTNLTASNITQSSVDLSWNASTDNVGVTGYDVYRNGVQIFTVTGTSAAITGLSASTTYSFYIRAKDAAGNVSSASNTISVTTLTPPDTEAPTAPTNLTASNITQSSVDLSWNASTDNVGVTGYDVYLGTTLLGTISGTAAIVTGLSASTSYSFHVRAKDAAGNISTPSNTVTITTLDAEITYCISRGNSTNREFINRVVLHTIDNESGDNGGYGDFTGLSTNLTKGSSYTVTIFPGWSGSSRNEAYRVWIDFNNNGIFESNELVFSRNRTNASSVSGSFTVPNGTFSGSTRMRVSMKFNSLPGECEVFQNGEVEDYKVNIITNQSTVSFSSNNIEDDFSKIGLHEKNTSDAKPLIDKETSIAKLIVYPNPVSGNEVYVQINGNHDFNKLIVYDALGRIVLTQDKESNVINISRLDAGVYFIQVIGNDNKMQARFVKN